MSFGRATPLIPIAAAVAVIGVVGAAAIGGGQDTPDDVVPATQRVLLRAPNPTGPTARGTFLRDPRGQVENIAAGDHLVAWSVRDPADPADDDNGNEERPVRFPDASRVVVVDERGGAPLVVELGRRHVGSLDFTHGPGGTAQPRIIVTSCGPQRPARCGTEALELTPQAPLSVARRLTGRAARIAARSDVGRSVSAQRIAKGADGKPISCLPRLELRDEPQGRTTTLPAIPEKEGSTFYPRCKGFEGASVTGGFVLASVGRDSPTESFEGRAVYAFELASGPDGRWRHIQTPYRYSDGSTGIAYGPAITAGALYWEEIDGDGGMYSIERVRLPEDVRVEPTRQTPVTAEPVAPDTRSACTIVATESAIYELANPRCSDDGDGAAGAIRRLVHPQFSPEPTE